MLLYHNLNSIADIQVEHPISRESCLRFECAAPSRCTRSAAIHTTIRDKIVRRNIRCRRMFSNSCKKETWTLAEKTIANGGKVIVFWFSVGLADGLATDRKQLGYRF